MSVSQSITKYLVVGMVIGIVLGGTSGYLVGVNNPKTTNDDGTDNNNNLNDTAQEKVFEMNMTAFQYGFDPDQFQVEVGTKVILHILSTANVEPQLPQHTFTLKEFGVRAELEVNNITTIEFVVDKVGEFIYECDVYCGTGHNNMRGTLYVTGEGEQQELEETIVPKTNLFTAAGNWDNENLFLIIEREGRSIAFLDGASQELVGRISDIGHQPHTAVFDESMNYAYTIGRGGWFVKVNLNTLEVEGFVRVGTDSRGTGITQDGNYVVISNYSPSNFVIVNTQTMLIEKTYGIPTNYNTTTGEPLPSRVAAVVDAPNNLMVVALKDVGEVWVLNMSEPGFPVIKKFYDCGELLHDAFLTEDGRYYMLASQKSNWVWVLDLETLEFVGKIITGLKPHPGPGAVWNDLAFSPSIGEGKLNIWNTSVFETHNYGDDMYIINDSVDAGGPGLFVRSYVRDMENYTKIWWDTVLSSNMTENRWIHVYDAELQNYTTIDYIEGNSEHYRTLHPEFTYDGEFVMVSVWEENGRIAILDAHTFEVVKYVDGLTTPTGIFNVGLRALHEWGL